MGIYYDGGMIVGAHASLVNAPDDLWEWAEDHNMNVYSLHYDADKDDQLVGFSVADVDMSNIDEWLVGVKEKASEFKKLTGIDAKLIGSQDIS